MNLDRIARHPAAQAHEGGRSPCRFIARFNRYLCAAAVLVALAASLGGNVAQAEDDYVIGVSAGLSGYTAQIDHAWADGVAIGAAAVNAQGGVLHKTIKIVVEDNEAQPQEAVETFNNMIVSDHAQAFVPGCFSAGNFAIAPIIARKQIPMIACSILPTDKNLDHWMFSTIPRPAFEIVPRLAFLQAQKIARIGIIYDQSPYASVQTETTKTLATKYGLTVVDVEQYQQTDTDLSIQIKKLQAAGAQAIIKNGNGPSTLLAARALKDLGIAIPLLTSNEDLAIFRDVAKVLGADFYFPVNPPQLFDTLSDTDPTKKVIAEFLIPWKKKYGDRDPSWAARGYDAVKLMAAAIRSAQSTDGAKIRDALEKIHDFQGTSGAYNFDISHYGVTDNPMKLGHFVDGTLAVVQ